MTLLSREKRRELATIVAAVATFKYRKKDGAMLSTEEMASVNMERAEWLVGLCWDAASDFSADMLDMRNEDTP